LDSKKKLAGKESPSSSGPELQSFESEGVQLGDLSLPETHVTLQYEGISLEAVHTFIRRTTGCEVVITGELMIFQGGFMLIARTTHDGPWKISVHFRDSHSEIPVTEVVERDHWKLSVKGTDVDALQLGFQRMALLIMTTIAPRFEERPERVLALLQARARTLGEFDLAIQLAKLAFTAAHEGGRDEKVVKRNLATAYNDKGIELAKVAQYPLAISLFKEAFELDPRFEQAQRNLRQAEDAVSEESIADPAIKG
jgi:hypothetical protein